MAASRRGGRRTPPRGRSRRSQSANRPSSRPWNRAAVRYSGRSIAEDDVHGDAEVVDVFFLIQGELEGGADLNALAHLVADAGGDGEEVSLADEGGAEVRQVAALKRKGPGAAIRDVANPVQLDQGI